jgi:hypothetical protein
LGAVNFKKSAKFILYGRESATMTGMKLTPQARKSILQRLAEIEPELVATEARLKELPNRSPTLTEVVTKGATLFGERLGLKRRLEHDDSNGT